MASKGTSDVLQVLAEDLLIKNLVESRQAIQGKERVEIFRGKDLLSYLTTHAEETSAVAKAVLPKKNEDRKTDDLVKDVCDLMMRRGYFVRSERLFKKPHPGRKKLTKFPRKVFFCEDQTFVPGGFYSWKIERPPTPWVYVGGYIAALLVLCCCLFPLAPYSIKLGVFYTSLSCLIFIFSIIGIRCFIFAVIWTLVGKYVWVVPNLFADNVPITEVFSPFLEEEKNKHGKPYPAPPLKNRILAVAALFIALFYAYRNTPEKGYGAKIRSSTDDMFDYLVTHGSMYQRIDAENKTGEEGAAQEPFVDPTSNETIETNDTEEKESEEASSEQHDEL